MYQMLLVAGALLLSQAAQAAPPDLEALKEKLAPNTALLLETKIIVGPIECTTIVAVHISREEAKAKIKLALSKANLADAVPYAGHEGDVRLRVGGAVLSWNFPANTMRATTLALAVLEERSEADEGGITLQWHRARCLVGSEAEIVVAIDGHAMEWQQGENDTFLGAKMQAEFSHEKRMNVATSLDRLFLYLTDVGRLTGDVRTNLNRFKRNVQNGAQQLSQSRSALTLLLEKRVTPLYTEIMANFPASKRLRYAKNLQARFLTSLD